MTEEHTMTYDYTLTRILTAPAERVWQAWTTPGDYEQWANAAPGSVSLDVRPGGKWQATMVTPGGYFALGGSYIEVVEHEKLTLSMDIPGAEPTVMGLALRPVDGGCEIVLSQACASAEERDMAKEGSGILLDGLTAFLAR
ncbi:SRPBCC domain-containing protein [Streptomyces sp. NPDC051940]|uniref:SRPBCC family protein n=1 Tax=Streptomyces sp. NPDC051940 TaxID=3155675 RepID=UPI00343F341C